jgi:DNA-binding NarL/FixJ family response regulator
MTIKPTLLIFDGRTKEETIRELTDDEILELDGMNAAFQAQENAKLAKIAARESALAKLAALGLTEAEIAAL